MGEIFCEDVKQRRFWQTRGVWIFAAAIVVTLVGGLIYASQGSPDPTEGATTGPSRGRRMRTTS